MPDRIALRPRTLLAVGDLALQFTRRNARWLAIPVACAAAPMVVVAWFTVGAGTETALMWLALALVGRVSSGLVTVACAELALHPTLRLGPTIAAYLGQLPRWLWVQTVEWLSRVPTLGLAAIAFAFAPEVALLERGGVGQVLARGNRLAAAHPALRWAMPVLAIGVPLWWYVAAALGWRAVLDVLELGGGPTAGLFDTVTFAGVLGSIVGEMAWAVLRFLLYLDCRTRGDGWDLQVQCQALVMAHAEPGRRAA